MIKFLKENRVICSVIACVSVFVLFVGFLILRGIIKDEMAKSAPVSTLTKTPRALTDDYLNYDELSMCVRCAGTDYVLWLPADAQVEEGCVKAKLGGINIIATVSDKPLEEVLSDYIPQNLYFSVLGYEPKTDIISVEDGYFKLYPANYAVSVSEARVSVRVMTCYVLSYELKISDNKSVYIAVSSESKSTLDEAKKLLDVIASSLRKYEDTEPAVQDAVFSELDKVRDKTDKKDDKEELRPNTRNGAHIINFRHKVTKATEDGIMVVMWENYTVEPVELTVFGLEGCELKRIKEECDGGFYVYEVGKAPAGTYVFFGSTDEVLEDIYVDVYEAEDYFRMYGAYDGD